MYLIVTCINIKAIDNELLNQLVTDVDLFIYLII